MMESGKIKYMCYNCGCQLPEDDMGKGKVSQGGGSLTQDDIRKIAKEWDMSERDVISNMVELGQKVLKEMPAK
jgi:hypothetical protein